ncbi:class I SAM-dependent methyltransferase [Yersinia bercovieri]|uniref:class I SAM-dependent methyltransferase n=1 Tax=Yersinia bercovieri TaxID=634 RepID=UPI0005E5BB3D|nr:class I SAM-dependent methyltransferase [Yersinia bercovieri]CFQ31111.1 bifunctional 3-demethylubiquinone-9 3-methyltransferase/ 2-octaprenyl-6-hydroxy phenol methylase [Yersinia bercovieri]
MADQSAEGILSPYLKQKRFEAATPYLKGLILDFGCGSGALSMRVKAGDYAGIDRDELSLESAQKQFPQHRFLNTLPTPIEHFDTVISPAVIEHVSNPAIFLKMLTTYLSEKPSSRLVITTPHPFVDWVHDLGAKIGLFSKHANDEHEDLLDRQKLENAGIQAGLSLVEYKRFLFGANQLAVYKRNCS